VSSTVTLDALKAGAALLLEGKGKRVLADLVRSARIEIAGPGEAWTIGARAVVAHRLALVVPAKAFLDLTRDTGALGEVKAAFAQAMQSPDTELANLHVELLLPGEDRPWSRAYRDAPVRDLPAPANDPSAILRGASALLEALGDDTGASMLGRARVELAQVPGEGTPLTRVVVRLAPADRAETWHDPVLEEAIRRAVHDAAIRAGEDVAVELGA
jgi:hypothetical protein